MSELVLNFRRQVNRLKRQTETPPPEVNRLSLHDWAAGALKSYFTLEPSPFHVWLSDELGTLHTRRGTRLNVVAPRGAAKSSWSSMAYPLWCAVYAIEPYIILTSDTGEQARKYLDSIRSELEANPFIARHHADAAGKGTVWRDDAIRLRNGVVVEAAGTGAKIRGRKNRQHRPSLIVADDPQNTGHVLSQLQRERSWEWLTRDVCNAGTPQTNIVTLGTALHRDCIVLRLMRTAGWRSKLWQAVVSWPDRMDLWKEWEAVYNDHENDAREADARAFYEARRAEMDAGSRVLWPEREDLYALMALKATIGTGAFSSEKQGSPVNPEACEWPEDYFDGPGFWFDGWPETLLVKTLSLDPSKGRDSRPGDYSAIVRLGVGVDRILYVEADVRRRTVEDTAADAVGHVRDFRPEAFCLETNGFQELLAGPLLAAAERARIRLPVYGVNNSVNKGVRIRRLGPFLAQRRIRFKSRSPGTLLLVQQLKDFPVADHDDGPDCLEGAIRMADHLLGNRDEANQPELLRA